MMRKCDEQCETIFCCCGVIIIINIIFCVSYFVLLSAAAIFLFQFFIVIIIILLLVVVVCVTQQQRCTPNCARHWGANGIPCDTQLQHGEQRQTPQHLQFTVFTRMQGLTNPLSMTLLRYRLQGLRTQSHRPVGSARKNRAVYGPGWRCQ